MAGVTEEDIVVLTTLFIALMPTKVLVKIISSLIFLVKSATKVFSRSPSRDSSTGSVVPNFISDASSSSSTCRSWKYDVFLSFRGEDTRKTFVDHLYSTLSQHGILTYKDDVTLDRGDTISPALSSAIHESHIALIIFSKNYADSAWCLDELLNIMKCKEHCSQIVIPIFYDVDPSDVRKQRGQFGKAFAKHKWSKSKNKVECWKKALFDASNIAGWELKHVANGHEARCIQKIVKSILDKLSTSDSTVEDENLVGMEYRLEQLKSQLSIGSGGVRMVGIWGIGGGGKTTLAFSAYNKLSVHFRGHFFIGNIREKSKQINGLEKLQKTILSEVLETHVSVSSVLEGRCKIQSMLCRRNVLIVLDDVDHLEQLKALAGSHEWFGDGSRIIITTRDEHLLKTHRVDIISQISLLSYREAVQLFNRHAYNEKKPVENYSVLTKQIFSYAAGLPLALIVLGSFLYDKNKDEWLSTLDRLKYHPEMDIVQKLKVSYDGLKDVEKELFLDIACFFRGKKKDKAMKILDARGYNPAIGVKVLIQKALITIKYGVFQMHDLVQEMGHYIVRKEHPCDPEKHSRVWQNEDIKYICSSMNATMENDKIEAIQCYVDGYPSNFIMLVSNMTKLRFLKVRATSFYEGPSFLSNELRYLIWSHYPASPFPGSFQPTKLLVIKMKESLQKEIWKGYKYLPCLKELELVGARELVRTPDFGGLPCLQKLILDGCESLEEIHPSLGNHNSLESVSILKCKKLTRFPTIVKMEKLKFHEISKCKALIEFPKIEANMDNLVKLSLKKVGIEILPSTIGEYCTNLRKLSLSNCSKLKRIDGNFHALKGLKKVEFRGCKQFEKLPKQLLNENLDELALYLDSSSIKQLIPSLVPRFLRILNLYSLGLKDGDIPNEFGELCNLQELHIWHNDCITRLDVNLWQLTRLKLLYMNFCKNLVELPELPSSLAILLAGYCESLEVIKDDVYRRCKWLCQVSIWGGRNNISGGERLLESMLQGKAVKSGCMIVRLNGSEIPRGFEPGVVRGGRYRMQLPQNWYNHYSGFLFCITFNSHGLIGGPFIKMKHVEKSVGGGWINWMGIMGDSQDDDDDSSSSEEETVAINRTCAAYVPFSLLRHTSWWDPTSTAVDVEFESFIISKVNECGLKLVSRRAAVDISSNLQEDDDDDYKCKLCILHDSKSAFTFVLNPHM